MFLDISELGTKCLDQFGISTEVSLDTNTNTALILRPKKVMGQALKNMGHLAKNMGFMGHCERQVCFVSDNHAACNT